jgi:hypothetical protein
LKREKRRFQNRKNTKMEKLQIGNNGIIPKMDRTRRKEEGGGPELEK